MAQKAFRVTILHTNDMHSELGAMSRLSSLARQLQHELSAEGRRVFFFDAGDAADRRERFTSITKGEAFPRILSAMGEHGYDLQTLGNAISFTYGPQAAQKMAGRSKFPILAANFFRDSLPLLEGFKPTISFALGGDVRLRVVGLTVQNQQIYRLFGLETVDFLDSAKEWVNKLKTEGRGPIVIVSHLGLREDRLLAEALPEIDLIIGGHSHSLLEEGEVVNGVLIAQAGEYAKYLGSVDLLVEPRSGKVIEKSARLIEIPEDTPPDPLFLAAVCEAEAEARQFMNQPVGELEEALDHDFFTECGIGDLAADAIRERMQADAALLSGGLFHKGLPAGIITLVDLDSACFSTANPNLSLVTGKQIRAALEQGLEPELMGMVYKAFRGAPVGLPAISGMEVIINPAAPNKPRIEQINIQGSTLENERLYRLAHTDAEVCREFIPFGLLDLEDGQLIHEEVPTILREAIADYLQAHSPTPKPKGERWRFLDSTSGVAAASSTLQLKKSDG